jgi:hypothetical protein
MDVEIKEELILFSTLKSSASLPVKSEESFRILKMSLTLETSISCSVSSFDSISHKQFTFGVITLVSVLD